MLRKGSSPTFSLLLALRLKSDGLLFGLQRRPGSSRRRSRHHTEGQARSRHKCRQQAANDESDITSRGSKQEQRGVSSQLQSRWHCPPPYWCPSPSAAPGRGIGGVHRRHRSGTREVHPVSRLAAGSRQGNVLETAEGERGGSEGPSGQRRACLSRAPCNPPTRKAPEASPERKSASCADRQAAGRLKKIRQALGGGWRRPTWLLAGQARREAPGQKAGEVVGREKPR